MMTIAGVVSIIAGVCLGYVAGQWMDAGRYGRFCLGMAGMLTLVGIGMFLLEFNS